MTKTPPDASSLMRGLADGIEPDLQTGEFRVTSVETRIYTVIMLAVHVFFGTVLVWQIGMFFGFWR